MGRRENYVEGYLVRQCKKRGFKCYKFTSPSNNGVPDRIVIGYGITAFVETKAPGEKARQLQLAVHREMRRHGAIVYVADTREDIDRILDELIEKGTSNGWKKPQT